MGFWRSLKGFMVCLSLVLISKEFGLLNSFDCLNFTHWCYDDFSWVYVFIVKMLTRAAYL